MTRKFLKAWGLCQRGRQLDGRKEVEYMHDSVLLSKLTFEALLKQVENFVTVFEITIRREERHKDSILSHQYDPTYLAALKKQKIHILSVLKQGKDEAQLVSSQRVQL